MFDRRKFFERSLKFCGGVLFCRSIFFHKRIALPEDYATAGSRRQKNFGKSVGVHRQKSVLKTIVGTLQRDRNAYANLFGVIIMVDQQKSIQSLLIRCSCFDIGDEFITVCAQQFRLRKHLVRVQNSPQRSEQRILFQAYWQIIEPSFPQRFAV